VVIIALGESLFAVGPVVATAVPTMSILAAALLGLTLTVCLWLLYFKETATVAERRLAELDGTARAWLARDLGTFLHFPIIAGVIYIAVGLEEILARISEPHAGHTQLGLAWPVAVALCGGAAVYLAGLAAIRWRVTQSRPGNWFTGAAVPLALIPAVHAIPPIAALGLITAVLAGLTLLFRLYPSGKRTIRVAQPR
jgi:low temperature requirement protein LtrA